VEVLLVAGIVGAAFGIHGAGEYQVLAVRREEVPIGLGRQVCDLPGVAAVRIHHPDLGRSASVGKVGDALGIGRPAWPLIGLAIERDLPRRASLEGHNPDLHRLLVRRHVDGLDREGHELAIGGELRVADPLQLQQSIHIKRLFLREHDRGRSEQEQETAHTSIVTPDAGKSAWRRRGGSRRGWEAGAAPGDSSEEKTLFRAKNAKGAKKSVKRLGIRDDWRRVHLVGGSWPGSGDGVSGCRRAWGRTFRAVPKNNSRKLPNWH